MNLAYMDYIQLYKNCDEVLQVLMTTQSTIFYDELYNISPEYASYIIQEFTSKGFAKEDQIMQTLSIDRIAARPYYYGRYYERLMDQAVANKKRDELSERGTISAEETAKWAKKSSDAAERSANIAGKANKIAIVAIIVSVIVAIMQVINSCTPIVQFINRLFK